MRTHVDIVRELLAGGCKWIQVREKAMPDRLLYEQLLQCRSLCEAAEATLLVNDRVDLAWASGSSGIHLGQSDLDPRLARSLLGPACIIGRSTCSVDQAVEADADPHVDYVAIGPIFSTLSKIDSDPPVGLEGLRAVRQAVRKPLVAIGGITGSSARDMLQAGCDSVAVISALMCADNIASQTAELLREVYSLSLPS